MNRLSQINWILIGLYSVFCMYMLATLNSSGMDAAGKGMAGGFTIVFFIYCAVLAGLNLIRVKWVKILVLILALLPLLQVIS